MTYRCMCRFLTFRFGMFTTHVKLLIRMTNGTFRRPFRRKGHTGQNVDRKNFQTFRCLLMTLFTGREGLNRPVSGVFRFNRDRRFCFKTSNLRSRLTTLRDNTQVFIAICGWFAFRRGCRTILYTLFDERVLSLKMITMGRCSF